jgi:hypothetical protein
MSRQINVITVQSIRDYQPEQIHFAVRLAAALRRGDFWLCIPPA